MATQDDDSSRDDCEDLGGASVVREEARHVLDGQLQILRETDRKAMATARVVSVILGLLLSVASLADTPSASFNRWLVFVAHSSRVTARRRPDVLGRSAELRDRFRIHRRSGRRGRERECSRTGTTGAIRRLDCGQQRGDRLEQHYLLVSQWLLVLGLSTVAVGLYRLV